MSQEVNANTITIPPSASSRPRRARRRLVGLLTFLMILLVLLTALCFIGVFGGNVRVVWPGKVYRSAQLTGNNYTADTAGWIGRGFDAILKTYRIKTVINLRGGAPNKDYYRDEIAECKRLGVDHVDVSMSASHLPPPESLRELLAAFDHDPYPILFHCQGGADRSGLVGTLYLDIYQHVSLDQAEQQQLTWRYGHFSFSASRAMDRFFTLYRQTGKGMDLRTWIMNEYPGVYAHETGSEGSSPQKVQISNGATPNKG